MTARSVAESIRKATRRGRPRCGWSSRPRRRPAQRESDRLGRSTRAPLSGLSPRRPERPFAAKASGQRAGREDVAPRRAPFYIEAVAQALAVKTPRRRLRRDRLGLTGVGEDPRDDRPGVRALGEDGGALDHGAGPGTRS